MLKLALLLLKHYYAVVSLAPAETLLLKRFSYNRVIGFYF